MGISRAHDVAFDVNTADYSVMSQEYTARTSGRLDVLLSLTYGRSLLSVTLAVCGCRLYAGACRRILWARNPNDVRLCDGVRHTRPSLRGCVSGGNEKTDAQEPAARVTRGQAREDAVQRTNCRDLALEPAATTGLTSSGAVVEPAMGVAAVPTRWPPPLPPAPLRPDPARRTSADHA